MTSLLFFEKFRDVFFFFPGRCGQTCFIDFYCVSLNMLEAAAVLSAGLNFPDVSCGGRKSLEAAELWVVMLRELCGAQSLLATRLKNPGKTQCMMVPLETSTVIFSDYSI